MQMDDVKEKLGFMLYLGGLSKDEFVDKGLIRYAQTGEIETDPGKVTDEEFYRLKFEELMLNIRELYKAI